MYMMGVVIIIVLVISMSICICWMLLVLWVMSDGVLNWLILCVEKVLMWVKMVDCMFCLNVIVVCLLK